SGMRSKRAAKVLQKKDYQVINVRGGMNQWNGKVRGGKL
ncbi:rhodanese-like domain-containing protein, partial [Alkalibacterium gilvum]